MRALDPPQVTVLVAAYNAAGFIGRAIGSALAQDGVSLEVLVVDDASTDDTVGVARALAAQDPRVRLVSLAQNVGPAGARNAGFAAAQGDWVAVLDADDAYEPGRLARLTGLGAAQGADLVADNFHFYDANSGQQGRPGLMDGPDAFLSLPDFLRGARPHTREADFGLLKPVFRRGFLETSGVRYPADSRHGEDFLLYVEVFLKGGRFLLSREPGYLYTTRSSGLSRTRIDYGAQIAHARAMAERPQVQADPEAHSLMLGRVAALELLMEDRHAQALLADGDVLGLLKLSLDRPRVLPPLARRVARSLIGGRHRPGPTGPA
jgi:succinoglycan biosynthesis protein ExoO